MCKSLWWLTANLFPVRPVMLFPVRRSSHISFAIGWEVPLVARNTITHGGVWILVNGSECATSGDMEIKRVVGF